MLKLHDFCNRAGQRLRDGLAALSEKHGFTIKQTGPVQMPQVLFDGDPDFRIGFAFADGMVRRGVHFHPWHNMFMNAAMTEADIDFALAQADEAFAEVRASLSSIEPHPVLMMLMGKH